MIIIITFSLGNQLHTSETLLKACDPFLGTGATNDALLSCEQKQRRSVSHKIS
jgi:hypothetical protein